jgi:hypothetical protein
MIPPENIPEIILYHGSLDELVKATGIEFEVADLQFVYRGNFGGEFILDHRPLSERVREKLKKKNYKGLVNMQRNTSPGYYNEQYVEGTPIRRK